jgi:hypothetical protein
MEQKEFLQCKGFTQSVPANGTVSNTLSLNGQKGKIVGVSVIEPTGTGIIINNLTINNKVLLDTVPLGQLERNASNARPFVDLPFIINGQDSIKIQSSAVALSSFTFCIWYVTG